MEFVRDVAEGRVVGVDSWLWQATPLEKDEFGNLQEPDSVGGIHLAGGGGSGGGGGSRGGGGSGGGGGDNSLATSGTGLGTMVTGMGTETGTGTGTGTGQQLGGGDVSHSSSYDSMLGGFGDGTGWGSVMTLNTLIAPPPKSKMKPPLPPRIQTAALSSSDEEEEDDDETTRLQHMSTGPSSVDSVSSATAFSTLAELRPPGLDMVGLCTS